MRDRDILVECVREYSASAAPSDRRATDRMMNDDALLTVAAATILHVSLSSLLLLRWIMVNYEESSQLKLWLFKPEHLEKCRERANREARVLLAATPYSEDTSDGESKPTLPVHSFAAGYASRPEEMVTGDDDNGPTQNAKGHAFVTPQEESLLVAFYASKLPSLIGPLAQVPRLRRDVKVVATAALLFRRFFLSNSVMLYDPKAVMVAAAFLGSKAEDATSDVRFYKMCVGGYLYTVFSLFITS